MTTEEQISDAGGASPSPLETEYQAIASGMVSSATRAWQAVSVLAAVFLAGAVVLQQVIPSKDFPDWLKISAIWTFATVATLSVYFWAMVMLREGFTQWTGHLRMIQIESTLGMKRETYQFLILQFGERDSDSLVGRIWRQRWSELPEQEQEMIRDGVSNRAFGVLPPRRLAGPAVLLAIGTAAGLLIACVAASVCVLTSESTPSLSETAGLLD